MANNNKNNVKRRNNIFSQLSVIRDRMNGIYKDTYSSDPERKQTLDSITNDIENTVSDIIGRNNHDVSGMSQLYTKMKLDQVVSDEKYTKGIVDYFENSALSGQLLNSYMDNKWVKDLDNEIDIVLKYMPKLGQALDAIKDAVLSADNFEKDFTSLESPGVAPDDASKFSRKTSNIKDAYQWNEKVEQWYELTSKYGETFVYKVPYAKAIQVLLAKKNNPGANRIKFNESKEIFQESSYIDDPESRLALASMKYTMSKVKMSSYVTLEVNNGGLLESAIMENKTLMDLMPIVESRTVYEQARLLTEAKSLDYTIPDKLEIPSGLDDTTADGLISANKTKKTDTDKIKVPGMLLKTLPHYNVIMLYINDDICLGYYYLEFINKNGMTEYSDNIISGKYSYGAFAKEETMRQQQSATDDILGFVTNQIVNQIDSKFINANPNLAKEIYAILDYNDITNNPELSSIRCTFIPTQDIEHITFKKDPVTHRGISDIANALIPAKLWCCLYITYTIGIITRGQDKRVYYVKQSVEQNIAQTLLNVVDQIKKNNFNIMQVENMNSILNMTGQFNDYIIPVGMSGDSPVSFEVIQGQDINPQTELMDKLEEHAITTTNCPLELLTARSQLDFATQITMTSNKFMRFTYKRQSAYEIPLSHIATDIFNTEYPDDSTTISCILPTPVFLNMQNFSQILTIVKDQAQSLAEVEYTDGDPDAAVKRQLFIQRYVYLKISGYIKKSEIDMVKNDVELKFSIVKLKSEE